MKIFCITFLVMISHSPGVLGADKDAKPFAEQFVIFQIDRNDSETQSALLDIANNLIRHYGGPDMIDIEVVAFREGVELFLASDNPDKERIRSLQDNGVRFYICKNTLDSMAQRDGIRPKLLPDMTIVPTGAAFLIEEIGAGYTSLKP